MDSRDNLTEMRTLEPYGNAPRFDMETTKHNYDRHYNNFKDTLFKGDSSTVKKSPAKNFDARPSICVNTTVKSGSEFQIERR